jgi:arginine deiminase
MPRVHVTSEIGPLRAVLVHTPGNELLAVTPGTREDFLYDDIIDLDVAQREHRRFVAVLERFADVYEVGDLLREIADEVELREFLRAEATDVVPSDTLAQRLVELPADELVALLIEGEEEQAGPIGRALNETGFALPPVPNLFFTRDIGIVVGDHAVIGSMRYEARWSEELLIKALFKYHPLFTNAGILYDGAAERRLTYTLEGGDVHPLRPDLVVLGFSSRSSPAALDHLCELLFECTPVQDVMIVVLPGERTAIHLDMIFTQIDRDRCIVFPPHFVGPERLAVLHRKKGQQGVAEMPDFFAALRAVDFSLEPIFCGGDRRVLQEREQWASGCNLIAVRPGVTLAYKRNEATLRELERAGYPIVDAVDFLTGERTLDEDQRAVLLLEGGELVRAGGGPRCMTMPMVRDDL